MAKVLVVDDSDAARSILTNILQKQGHEIVGEAINAAHAIKLYHNLKPDLVTMDVLMPIVDGLDGIGALKEIIKKDPQAKVIMISSEDKTDNIIRAIRAGAVDFLLKPLKTKPVVTAIEKALKPENH